MGASVKFKTDLVNLQNDLLHFALKLTSSNDEANDLVQETSLRALDNEEKYIPNTNFKGWLYTIMHNVFINGYRRIIREQTYTDVCEDYFHLNLSQDSGIVTAEGELDLQEMHRLVNELPNEYRQPFAMHVAGFKYKEIADKLNMPMGTVKSRIYLTRQTLQQQLSDFR